jgi:putative nucleotidyltransferase with HDIG domain
MLKKLKVNFSQKWLYFCIVASLSALFVYLSIPQKAQFEYEYRLGQIWLEDDLIAPIDFVLPKSADELEAERQALIGRSDLFYDFTFTPNQWSNLFKGDTSEIFVEQWKRNGVVAQIPSPSHYTFLTDGADIDLGAAFTPDALRAKHGWSDSVGIAPTFILNQPFTDSVLHFKQSLLTANKGIVVKGTPIILRGATLTEDVFEVLRAFENSFDADAQNLDWTGRLGTFLYIVLILLGLAIYLNTYDPTIIAHSSSLNLYFFTFAGAAVATLWSTRIPFLSPFAVPLILLPVLLRSFFNDRIALVTHIFLLLLVAPFISGSLYFFAVQFSAALVTLFNIRGIYKRSQLFQSTLFVMLVIALVHLSFHLIRQSQWTFEAATPLLSSLAGSLILLFVFPLIYFFERAFSVVSDLTLLELSDTNSPLLKRLSKEAPGTFQHTMQVANLAEHAAELVGGNTLLVRTGALYHDIGKIENALYFTENQASSASPHDELSYTESAAIIIGHVNAGIELAKKNHLPDIVIDFIRTHHGTSRVEYFYRKFKEDHPDAVKFESFQYPGPKPFSKETAIVMMSDAVEASTRSLPEKSQSKLNEMIDRVIDHQLSTGQLDNADISLKEIHQIRAAFKKFIRGVYHVRVEYPKG